MPSPAKSADDILGRLVPAPLRELMRSRALAVSRPVWGRRHGRHASARAGIGLEFRGHRPYVPGDDLRMFDWRAAARRDRLVLRQTESEDELPLEHIVDAGGGMGYGEGPQNKLAFALALMVGLGWLAIRQGDAVGLALAHAHEIDVGLSRPAAGRERLDAMVRRLGDVDAAGRCSWDGLLQAVSPRLPRRSLVVLASDLLDPGATAEEDPDAAIDHLLRGLAHLRARRHDVVIVQTLHPDEVDFPFHDDRMIRFEDPTEARDPLEASGLRVRAQYLAAVHAWLAAVQRRCESEGLLLVRLRTDEPIADAFLRLLDRFSGGSDAAQPVAAGGSP
jgi:uncharacterized protein (DUF58 family)